MTSKAVELTSAREIDLTRHGVIEAHAGTGKTHTIVDLVLRILEQVAEDASGGPRRVHAREILLVTFTEKAAGELQKRIREGLEKRIAELRAAGPDTHAELVRHLEDCRNNLHEPLIGTIHSVCLRLLQTWPFETGVHFQTEVVDDEEGLESALRESIRTDWQEESSSIPWALARLEERDTRLEEKHFALIRRVAREILDEDHAVLDRAALAGRTLGDLAQAYRAAQERVSRLLPGLRTVLGALADALEKVRRSGRMPGERLALLEERLPELRRMQAGGELDRRVLRNPCKVRSMLLFTKDLAGKLPGAADAQAAAAAVSGHEAVTAMEEQETLSSQVLLALVCDAAETLARRWNRTKRERGLLSYNDMLRLMHRAVHANPAYVESLRGRLRYGIIDEFQDTSALQWEVFQRIFVDDVPDSGPRMYVVGDPKQSIFAFQGADVQAYLAARAAVCASGGVLYRLRKNYRSLAATIEAVNAVLAARDPSEDWFLAAGESGEGISYAASDAAGAADRAAAPSHAPSVAPVQVMALAGNAGRRRSRMAEWTCRAIRALRGTVLSVPKGTAWTDLTLDYEHFAVIVETHALAEPFLDAFREEGIPAAKYKMEGVFQSPMARDLHAVLRAILHRHGDPAPRLAALLTHFFNRAPEGVDPERDLEPCGQGPDCRGENACIAHALQEWARLADTLRWAQLFRSIQTRTGVRERLARLRDGERHLADLSQVTAYCMEKLCRENMGLERLVEHLGMLYRKDLIAGQDQNLHVLATSRSCVKVLTMHAAKGLEFPVVFAATGASKSAPGGASFVSWSGADRRRHVMPCLSIQDARKAQVGPAFSAEELHVRAVQQERRRLLYVALTRAQALLFVPLHLQEISAAGASASPLPTNSPDEDLTPRLQKLLGAGRGALAGLALFDPSRWRPTVGAPAAVLPAVPGAVSPAAAPDIAGLKLLSRICRQTSYSQLSRQALTARETDRSEEPGDEQDEPEETGDPQARPALPGGRRTGDALHLAIEELLSAGHGEIEQVVTRCLERNGVLRQVARYGQKTAAPAERRAQAVAAACGYVNGALSAQLELPGGGSAVIGALEETNRIPEMEFLLPVGPHWVHGYMDLVFRMPLPGAPHPWRYFVLDWKSDTLAAYDRQHVEEAITGRHYDLQARLYSHALDMYLRGVLGKTYDPESNLGGAVYVFVRGIGEGKQYQWSRKAEPERDRKYVHELVGNQGG